MKASKWLSNKQPCYKKKPQKNQLQLLNSELKKKKTIKFEPQFTKPENHLITIYSVVWH